MERSKSWLFRELFKMGKLDYSTCSPSDVAPELSPRKGWEEMKWYVFCIISQASVQNWGSEHLHCFQHERQMIHKRGHGHAKDPGFISTPPPERQRRLSSACGMVVKRLSTSWSYSNSLSHTDNVLPDTESCLLMPPFLGSRSGERERKAMVASCDEGKGTSR